MTDKATQHRQVIRYIQDEIVQMIHDYVEGLRIMSDIFKEEKQHGKHH